MMKKLLLTLGAAFLAMGANASAYESLQISSLPAPAVENVNGPLKGASANGYDLNFSGNLNTWYIFSQESGLTYRNYVYVDPEMATHFAGNTVESITFTVGMQGSVTSTDAFVFVAEDLDADYLAYTELTAVNNYNSNKANNVGEFETPYVIKEGVGFYYGYGVKNCTYSNSAVVYPVGIGTSLIPGYGGYSDLFTPEGEYMGTVDVAAACGAGLYVVANTVGDVKSLDDYAVLGDCGFSGNFSLPYAKPGEPLKFTANIINAGSNALKEIGYTVDAGDGNPVEGTLKVNISVGKSSKRTINLPAALEGCNTIVFTLTSVNGSPCNLSSELSYVAFDEEIGFDQKVVVEEGTGTWCGWCPRGIVGMDAMEEAYPDSFLGIAVHSGDQFESPTYAAIVNAYFTGFPSAIVMRDTKYNIDPAQNTLQTNYNKWVARKSFAKVDLNVNTNDDGESLEAIVETTFALDAAHANYSLAFAVLEDGLSARQTNYYAGGGNGAMGGWESKPQQVNWTYTNTGVNIYDAFGIEGSVPESLEANKPVTFTYSVPLDGVKDVAKTKVVAMLLDNGTGVVVNADMVEAANYGTSGINDLVAPANATVTGARGEIIVNGHYSSVAVYNLSGQKVGLKGLSAGLYIVNVDGHAQKVVVK